MRQADHACTTRRALFGGALGLSLLATAGATAAQPRALTSDQRQLVEWLAGGWGEDGRAAAMQVISAGYSYEDVECVTGVGRGYERRRITIYVFEGDKRRAFTPAGETQAQWWS